MNAKEATQLAVKGPAIDLEPIMARIRAAAARGEFSITFSRILKPAEIRRLKELGFDCKNTSPRHEALAIISWPQPEPEPVEEEQPDPEEPDTPLPPADETEPPQDPPA